MHIPPYHVNSSESNECKRNIFFSGFMFLRKEIHFQKTLHNLVMIQDRS
jgi:hypothetical protein